MRMCAVAVFTVVFSVFGGNFFQRWGVVLKNSSRFFDSHYSVTASDCILNMFTRFIQTFCQPSDNLV